ncbi:hypothetical protein EJ110_NYTH58213 [Nymphaea thermarum]|nr:hypothetical protein EJ110_NYTH58213 [Nymphaea thermarum]
MYAITMSVHEPAQVKEEVNTVLGKLQITWRTNLGEPGRLQTQQILGNTVDNQVSPPATSSSDNLLPPPSSRRPSLFLLIHQQGGGKRIEILRFEEELCNIWQGDQDLLQYFATLTAAYEWLKDSSSTLPALLCIIYRFIGRLL